MGLFHQIKDEVLPVSPGIRVLCPTRWTVRASSMKSIIENYSASQDLLENAAEIIWLDIGGDFTEPL